MIEHVSAVVDVPRQVYHSEDRLQDLKLKVTVRPRWPKFAPPQDWSNKRGVVEVFSWQEHVQSRHERRSEGGKVGPYLFSRLPRDVDVQDSEEYEPLAGSEDGVFSSMEAVDEADEDAQEGTRRCRWRHCSHRKARHVRLAKDLSAHALARRGLDPYEPEKRMQLLIALPHGDDPLPLLHPTVEPRAEHRAEECTEVLLCELVSRHGGGTLEVRPPLWHKDKEVDGMLPYAFKHNHNWYEYSVENVSHKPTEDERKTAKVARRDFEASAPALRRAAAGAGLEQLSGDAEAHLAVFGEIISFEPNPSGDGDCLKELTSGDGVVHPWRLASSVDGRLDAEAPIRCGTPVSLYSALFCPAFATLCELSLPAAGEWWLDSSPASSAALAHTAQGAAQGAGNIGPGSGACMDLVARTQFAQLSNRFSHREACVFNHPIELHLIRRPVEPAQPSVLPHDPLPPRLVFQVHRASTWGRRIFHGYAFVDVPCRPGTYELRAQLWAPEGTIRQELSAIFCGTFLPLASPHLVAVADARRRDGLPRNRSALRTRTACGCLRIRLCVVLRRHAAGQRPLARDGDGPADPHVPRRRSSSRGTSDHHYIPSEATMRRRHRRGDVLS